MGQTDIGQATDVGVNKQNRPICHNTVKKEIVREQSKHRLASIALVAAWERREMRLPVHTGSW